MKDISEYLRSGNDHELFSFFYDRIIRGEAGTFQALRECAGPAAQEPRARPVILKAFELIKTLHWGYFACMTPETHRRLWRELVIPDQLFPEAGDLKRTLSISNLYVAMLDIHGYTKFCQESRKNLSMMHTLDRAINGDIRAISTACQAVSQRERGDEIVVVAATASDALSVTIGIIDYFARTSTVRDPALNTQRSGDARFLPAFKISAGVTGGNTSSPLIITEQGNLSGFLLNSGARLQVRANELSPVDSRVMVTKQVQMNFMKENASGESCALFRGNAVYFMETGAIEFKGVLLPTCEAVFRPEERYKEQFSAELAGFFASINGNLWEQKICTDLMELLARASDLMPKFSFAPSPPVAGIPAAENASVRKLCQETAKAWVREEDYIQALALFRELLALLKQVPHFDRLLLDYARGVYSRYESLLAPYMEALDREIEKKLDEVFPAGRQKTWIIARNASKIYETLRVQGRKSPVLARKKAIWYGLITANQDKMEMTLYSGKK